MNNNLTIMYSNDCVGYSSAEFYEFKKGKVDINKSQPLLSGHCNQIIQ